MASWPGIIFMKYNSLYRAISQSNLACHIVVRICTFHKKILIKT